MLEPVFGSQNLSKKEIVWLVDLISIHFLRGGELGQTVLKVKKTEKKTRRRRSFNQLGRNEIIF
jgi:hypothetical protein